MQLSSTGSPGGVLDKGQSNWLSVVVFSHMLRCISGRLSGLLMLPTIT